MVTISWGYLVVVGLIILSILALRGLLSLCGADVTYNKRRRRYWRVSK